MAIRLGAAILGVTVVAAAMSAAQEPRVSQSAVTMAGCVETETAYRARVDPGNEVVPGVGPGDLVLSGATGTVSGAGTPPPDLEALVSAPATYALTGRREAQVTTQAGARVQVVGFVEDLAEPQSLDGILRLRRLVISEWQPLGGACQ